MAANAPPMAANIPQMFANIFPLAANATPMTANIPPSAALMVLSDAVQAEYNRLKEQVNTLAEDLKFFTDQASQPTESDDTPIITQMRMNDFKALKDHKEDIKAILGEILSVIESKIFENDIYHHLLDWQRTGNLEAFYDDVETTMALAGETERFSNRSTARRIKVQFMDELETIFPWIQELMETDIDNIDWADVAVRMQLMESGLDTPDEDKATEERLDAEGKGTVEIFDMDELEDEETVWWGEEI